MIQLSVYFGLVVSCKLELKWLTWSRVYMYPGGVYGMPAQVVQLFSDNDWGVQYTSITNIFFVNLHHNGRSDDNEQPKSTNQPYQLQ